MQNEAIVSSTAGQVLEFEVQALYSEQTIITPKMDMDFGNVVQLRLIFFNLIKQDIFNITLDLTNVNFIDEITLDVLMAIAKQFDTLDSDWNITFKNLSPDLMDLIKETPLTYLYDNITID